MVEMGTQILRDIYGEAYACMVATLNTSRAPCCTNLDNGLVRRLELQTFHEQVQ